MKRLPISVLLFTFALPLSLAANAQVEGPVPTQALVNVDAKSQPPASADAVTVAVNDHKQPLTAWAPVAPTEVQVAVLLDDGLRESVGRELDNLRSFVRGLPPGVEVMVGYMQHGSVVADQEFTADHELAASSLRLPHGIPGTSASPYMCLSDFVKKWPGSGTGNSGNGMLASARHKARFVLMITNGVDPYNGSTSVMNQGSPYVDAAVEDAQRAGVAVYSIYFGNAGMGGGSVNSSGQDYLSQITEATGGVNYYQGLGNPPSTAPFLRNFQSSIAETYIATFNAPAVKERELVRVKFAAAKAKFHAPDKVHPGNVE